MYGSYHQAILHIRHTRARASTYTTQHTYCRYCNSILGTWCNITTNYIQYKCTSVCVYALLYAVVGGVWIQSASDNRIPKSPSLFSLIAVSLVRFYCRDRRFICTALSGCSSPTKKRRTFWMILFCSSIRRPDRRVI